MPGQQNRTANSWGRRRVLERESWANERLMPPSRAESVATVGAAYRRTRARYVRHRYSVSCPLLPPWLPPTFTIAPPASTLPVAADTLTFPYRPSARSPSLAPAPFIRCSSRALRSLASRPHRVYVPHSRYLYMYTYASMYKCIQPRTVTDRRRSLASYYYCRRFHGK